MSDETYDPCAKPGAIELGHDHRLVFTCWKPDRDINPQYNDLPDIDKVGAIVSHPRADGKPGKCWSSITFRSPTADRVFPEHTMWDVLQEEPLTVSPSILCRECGDHGFIRGGQWQPA